MVCEDEKRVAVHGVVFCEGAEFIVVVVGCCNFEKFHVQEEPDLLDNFIHPLRSIGSTRTVRCIVKLYAAQHYRYVQYR